MSRRSVRAVLAALAVAIGGAHARGQATFPSPPSLPPLPTREGGSPAASFHEGFEGPRPSWRQEDTDAPINLKVHERTDRAWHDGKRAERFVFDPQGPGSAFYYSFLLPKITLADDLQASLFVRSDHVGVQLLGRVVLPADTDPETGQPSFVMIPGGTCDVADRWQRLSLVEVRTAVEQQARVLRHSTKRKLSLEGAYLERLVVNLFGGPGETEVYLDDLTISPVPDSAIAPVTEPPAIHPGPGRAPAAQPRPAGVKLEGGRLTRDGQDWVPSILSAPGADPALTLPFGFDVAAVPMDDLDRARAAVAAGFLLMPVVGEGVEEPRAIVEAMASYRFKESVAFWHLGGNLGASTDPAMRQAELERVRAVVAGLRELPEGVPRLTTGDVAGLFTQYALPGQNLDLMGVDPHFWASFRDPTETLAYLQQRRNLTALWNLRAPFVAWVDAAPPPVVRSAVWGVDTPPPWGDARVQPEQVRLAAYAALMAGYRGLAFRADAGLTRDSGRANLYEMALLNAEVDLVQSILAKGAEPIIALPTFRPDPKPYVIFNPNASMGSSLGRSGSASNPLNPQRTIFPETKPHESIKAASIPALDGRGRLLLIADLAPGGQWQPPQSALNDLKVVVTGVPENAVVWEIGLGGLSYRERERLPGGLRFALPSFDLTTMVLVTTDDELARRLRTEIEKIRPRAVDLAIKQAKRQYEWLSGIHAMLVRDGHPARDADDLLSLARGIIAAAEEAQANEDYPTAWSEARRTGRTLRHLMRDHWDRAYFEMSDIVQYQADQEALRAFQGANFRSSPRPRRFQDPKTGEWKKPTQPKIRGFQAPKTILPAVGSPPLVAANMLPQHFIWTDWADLGSFSRNLIASGDFDVAGPADLVAAGWVESGYHDDTLKTRVELEPAGKGRTGKVLKLSVRPPDPSEVDAVTPFQDHPAAAVRTPAIPVRATQFVRISVRVKLPRMLPSGGGGLIVRDSIGGERLQFRMTDMIRDWTQVVLYRRVPEDRDMTVLLGLAGLGDAFFDDLRIEVLERRRRLPSDGPDLARTPLDDRPINPNPPGRRASAAARPESAGRSVR
jgi:hypothetical protein